MPLKKKPPKLKRLTSRVLQLTRRRQLHLIFEENEIVNREHWKLNTIVMNAVIEASPVGSPKLSARLICGLVNALIEADLCRSNGLLAQYGFLLHEGGNPSVLFYNLLMKGHISAGCPEVVINLHDEMSHVGLEPDSLSYNILISACIKTKKLDVTMPFNEQLKDNGQKCSSGGFHPDIFTYATLLMGFRHAKDLQSLLEIVFEMKSCCNLILDRSTFTAMVDALLYSGSIKVVGLYALCIFGEIVKRVCSNPGLWPKPHLYVSMMHELAARVDYDIVKSPYRRMWPDSTGTISPEVQEEAGHLLMEAALNDGQAAIRIEALLGLMKSMFSPYLLPQDHPIERIMMPVEEARPLPGTIALRKVVMRLFRDPVVPIVDDYCCTVKPAVRSIGHVIDLILAKRHKMVVVVKCGNLYGTGYSSTSRAVGFLTS
ncbi:hypothetical protein CICLE_v10010499mg [Citrus x clementina]|uniref:Uncharacterized protein n=1 Tax=Citrus clementina TaxID=85681 RepID=V4UBK5_CITCL|nr:hypothetical protein CICLE_v10010499mg [Citrus x clementina]